MEHFVIECMQLTHCMGNGKITQNSFPRCIPQAGTLLRMRKKQLNGATVIVPIFNQYPCFIMRDEILFCALIKCNHRKPCRHRLQKSILCRSEMARAEQIAEHVHFGKLRTHILHIVNKM